MSVLAVGVLGWLMFLFVLCYIGRLESRLNRLDGKLAEHLGLDPRYERAP